MKSIKGRVSTFSASYDTARPTKTLQVSVIVVRALSAGSENYPAGSTLTKSFAARHGGEG